MAAKQREPIFNIPGAVTVVIALIVGVHVILTTLMPLQQGNLWTLRMAFIPTRFSPEGAAFPGGEWARYWQFFSHQIVHADWLHVGLNCAWLLAFGSGIARRAGNARFLAFSLVCGVAGILTFWALNQNVTVPVIGASGAVSGMMAGALRFVFSAQIEAKRRGHPVPIESVPLASIFQLARIPAVVLLVIAWIGINYIFGVSGFGAPDEAKIAWEAHLGGFVFGMLAYGFFDRQRPEWPSHPPDNDDYDDGWAEDQWTADRHDDADRAPPGTTIH